MHIKDFSNSVANAETIKLATKKYPKVVSWFFEPYICATNGRPNISKISKVTGLNIREIKKKIAELQNYILNITH